MKKIEIDGQEIEISDTLKELESKIKGVTVDEENRTVTYTLKFKIFKDADKKLPVTKITLSDPTAGKIKKFRISQEQTIENGLIAIFACSDLEGMSIVEKLKGIDIMNLISIAYSFLY